MGVQEKIFKWVQNLDPWKQELFLRASATPELSDADVREVTSMLLGEEIEGTRPRAVTADDLPGARRGQDPMAVVAVGELRNVNAIADGQSLEFEPSGLNVVYGKNGAGKTGYSRILKHAGRTLYRETILTNVMMADGSGPSATVTVSVGGDTEPIPLDLQKPGPARLGRICIADEQACEVYLTSDTEVDYAPVMLTNLKRFRDGLERVDAELVRCREEAEPADLDLGPYGVGTKARALLEDLPTATPQRVEELAALTEQEQEQRDALRRKLGEIEAAQAPSLRRAAEQDAVAADRLEKELEELEATFGDAGTAAARERAASVERLRRAADLAAKGFEDEPLAGVGTDPWRALWKAAREYAAHVRRGLPADHDFEHCPLCMQELGSDARQRLQRFDQFVRSEVNAQLEVARTADEEALKLLPDPEATRSRHEDTLARLGLDEGQAGQLVISWLGTVAELRARLLAARFDGLQGVGPAPQEVAAWAAKRRKEAGEHAALEKADDQVVLRAELGELDSRQALNERREVVLAHLAAEAEGRRIHAAKGDLGKTEASGKMTQLSRELVQEDLQDALNRQLEALGFYGLTVEAKAKTPKGTPKVGLVLKTVAKEPLTSVLSKGEQRRLSLAMFLAEMEVASDPSPIVLDDPVTSVDQEGRRHIAQTLVELARKRQVIVFTHELSFVHELQRATRQDDLPLRIQQLRRIEGTVGHVSDELPWTGLKSGQRFEWLKKKLDVAEECFDRKDDDAYRLLAAELCMLLRQSFERAVEEDVLGNVVTRRSDTVRMTALSSVAFSEEICDLVDRGTDDNSPWVHDQPIGDGADPPTPAEIRRGLDLFQELRAATKALRKVRESGAKPSGKLAVVESLDTSPEPEGEGAILPGA